MGRYLRINWWMKELSSGRVSQPSTSYMDHHSKSAPSCKLKYANFESAHEGVSWMSKGKIQFLILHFVLKLLAADCVEFDFHLANSFTAYYGILTRGLKLNAFQNIFWAKSITANYQIFWVNQGCYNWTLELLLITSLDSGNLEQETLENRWRYVM